MKFTGKTQAQVDDDKLKAAEDAGRMERDNKLKACDWTQARDVQLTKDKAWQEYRKALRDITKQASWPFNIQWPEEP